MKKKLSGLLNLLYLSLFLSCTFKVILVVFADVHFCGDNGPLPHVIISALYFKHALSIGRLELMEMKNVFKVVGFTEQLSLITRVK